MRRPAYASRSYFAEDVRRGGRSLRGHSLCVLSLRMFFEGVHCVNDDLAAWLQLTYGRVRMPPFQSGPGGAPPSMQNRTRQSDRDTIRIALKNPSASRNNRTSPEFCHNLLRTNALLPRGFSWCMERKCRPHCRQRRFSSENRRITLAIQCPSFAGAGRRSSHSAR
jgi:hypothetical protein